MLLCCLHPIFISANTLTTQNLIFSIIYPRIQRNLHALKQNLLIYTSMLKQTKRSKEIVARFEYYAQSMNEVQPFPSTPHNPMIRKQKVFGPSRFYYLQSKRQSIRNFQLLNGEILSNIAERTLKNGRLQQKTDGKMTTNEGSNTLNEQVEICVVPSTSSRQNSQNASIISWHSVTLNRKSILSPQRSKQNPDKYSIYIFHSSKQPTPQWIYYVERISVDHGSSTNQENSSQVLYQVIIGVQEQTGILNSLIKMILPQKNQTIFTNHSASFDRKLSLFQSTLIKQLKSIKIKNSNESKIAHPQFKRQDNIPIEHYKKFQQLKVQIYKYYSQLNRNKKPNHYSIDNLICRFLKFKEYGYQQSLKAIKNYLNWQKSTREKYNMESFAQYKQLNLYEMIGKDKEGRVMLLFRPYNVYPDKIADENKYVDYTLYMLDIFIEDNTEGYIDDFLLIADYGPFGAQHFKLSLARNVADRAKELFPDRQFKLICFGLGSFSYFMYKFIKPFLPAFVLEKTAIFGTDKEQMKEFLSQYVNLDDLPAEIIGEKTQQRSESYSPTREGKLQRA